jgi:hypothetical protein
LSDKKEIVELGKRQTALLITLVSMGFVLALAGIAGTAVSGRTGKTFIETIQDKMRGEDYNAEGMIQPFAQWDDPTAFPYYQHPDHIGMDWGNGTAGTAAAWNTMYPYRVTFFGATKTSSSYSKQGYDSVVYVLYSKTPTVNWV